MRDIPEDYLEWLLENVELRGRLYGAVVDALHRHETFELMPEPEPDTVRSIYRELAMKYHPDRGGSTTAMAALNEFYERLKSAISS